MHVNELKTECRLKKDGQPLEAMLHLIEVVYNDRITFWNGVAQLTTDQVNRLGEMPAGQTMVGVELSDGRTGFLDVTHGS